MDQSERAGAGSGAPAMRFTLREFAGGLGDLGTFLPIAAALSAVNHMNLALIFVFAGLMNIASGLVFRLPVPVQPMKAIAAVAIAEAMTPGAIGAAGMAMGVIMTLLALVGLVDWIDRVVPRAIIRGIQAGIGAKLIVRSARWIFDLPPTGVDSVLVALIAVVLLVVVRRGRIPALLVVFTGGAVIAWVRASEAVSAGDASAWGVVVPSGQEWWLGLTRGAMPQLPLTMLNSVLAVCALSADLFPRRPIRPRTMALSVGLMNLVCVPFGGMPMCHGAGGLAAQYRFGARTAGSVVMLGICKIVVGIAFAGVLGSLIAAYPRSLLAAMLVLAGVTLMRPAGQCVRVGTEALVMLVTAVSIVAIGTLEGFVLGCLIAGAARVVAGMRGRHRRKDS